MSLIFIKVTHATQIMTTTSQSVWKIVYPCRFIEYHTSLLCNALKTWFVTLGRLLYKVAQGKRRKHPTTLQWNKSIQVYSLVRGSSVYPGLLHTQQQQATFSDLSDFHIHFSLWFSLQHTEQNQAMVCMNYQACMHTFLQVFFKCLQSSSNIFKVFQVSARFKFKIPTICYIFKKAWGSRISNMTFPFVIYHLTFYI